MLIEKKYLLYFRFCAIFVVFLTILGAIKNYSPVPFMDMWDGYLDFYVQVMDGNWNAWFKQHNEHRTIFSNLFFFIDLQYFEGLGFFLIILNIALMFFLVVTMYLLVNDLFGKIDNKIIGLKEVLISFSFILIFSWIQKENITWGFQSQFFAAYLLPLLSFYLYVKSIVEIKNLYFFAAVFFAIISVGTMANGVLVLPIIFLLSIVLRDSKFKIISILLITIIILSLFFYDYKSVGGHGSLFSTLKNNPFDFIKYFFAYIGSIYYPLLGSFSKTIPQFFGFLFCLSVIFFLYQFFIRKQLNKYYLVFFSFFIYYLGTAFITTGGRALFGIHQAFSSRYMTPTLIAWDLLLILWIHYFVKNNLYKNIKLFLYFFIFFSFCVFFNQIGILKNNSDENMDKKIAILNLKMNIRDEEYTKTIFPFTDWLFELSKKPIEKNLSIFASEDFKDIPNSLNGVYNLPQNELIGHLDEKKDLNNFIRLRGWIFNKNEKIPKKLLIINENGRVIGYAFSGYKRIDVEKTINKNALKSGFIGYILKENLTESLYLIDAGNINSGLKIKI